MATVEEFLGAFGADRDGYRRELVDGAVVVTLSPDGRHQSLSSEIWLALRQVTRGSALRPFDAVNVRLSANRLAVPDVVLPTRTDVDFVCLDAGDIVLAVEIVSPSSGSADHDRRVKPRLYAEAGIRWVLRVEPAPGHTPRATLYRLDPERRCYIATVTARDGIMALTEPVSVSLDLTETADTERLPP